jgi:hypothetical protein
MQAMLMMYRSTAKVAMRGWFGYVVDHRLADSVTMAMCSARVPGEMA